MRSKRFEALVTVQKLAIAALCLLVMGSAATAGVRHGAGYECGVLPILAADGSITDDSIPAGYTVGYLVHLKDGHSYSAEVWDPTDNYVTPGSATLALWDMSCSGSTLPTQDIVSIDPDLSGSFGDRISWVQSGDADAILVLANSDSSNNYAFKVRLVDTTLTNSRWSTVLGFGTHYGFLNTTNSSISGNLNVVVAKTGTVYSVGLNIPAGGEMFETISSGNDASPGLQLPAGLAGFATFTFVGPPGAVAIDGYYQAVENGIYVIVPTAWRARDSQH